LRGKSGVHSFSKDIDDSGDIRPIFVDVFVFGDVQQFS
jgi:hypothetical protein